LEVGGAVERPNGDALGRLPGQLFGQRAGGLLPGVLAGALAVAQPHGGEMWNLCHDASTPSSRSISLRVPSTSHLMKMKRSTPALGWGRWFPPGWRAGPPDRARPAFGPGAS